MKKIKPVKAWAMVSRQATGAWICAYWTFDSRKEFADDATFHREGAGNHFNRRYDKWIRVEIRPLYSKPPRRGKKKNPKKN